MSQNTTRSLLCMLMVVVAIMGMARSSSGQPGFSSLELRRGEATALFGARLQVLSQTRQMIVKDQGRYAAACLDKTTKGRLDGGGGVPLNGAVIGNGAVLALGQVPSLGPVPSSVEIRNDTTPECRILAHDIAVASTQLRSELAALDEEARRRGVYPGIMRELRTRYGLSAGVVR